MYTSMTTDFISAMYQAIQTYLPQDLHEQAKAFTIPIEFIEKMPHLVELVLRSRSMSEASEKQSRFNLFPLMTDDQIAKLLDILNKEKEKLEEIEKRYEEKKLEIKKKYLMRWQSMGYIKKMEELKEQEAHSSQQDQEDADALLDAI